MAQDNEKPAKANVDAPPRQKWQPDVMVETDKEKVGCFQKCLGRSCRCVCWSMLCVFIVGMLVFLIVVLSVGFNKVFRLDSNQ